MNKIKLIIAVIFFSTAFGLNSCDNEPVDPAIDLNPVNPVIIPGNTAFSANFDGETYTADQAEGAIFGGQIIINSYKGSAQEGFTITIDGTTTGSYLANENSITYSPGIGSTEIYESINPDNPDANTGQITITAIDAVNKKISGNFNFTGYYRSGSVTMTKVFTNGTFTSVPYTD